jgi:hypothetical protein
VLVLLTLDVTAVPAERLEYQSNGPALAGQHSTVERAFGIIHPRLAGVAENR